MSSCRRRGSRSEGGFRISNFEFVGAREAGGLIGAGRPRLGTVENWELGIRNAAPPPGGIFSLWGPAATMPRGVLSFGLLAVSVSCGYYEESNWRDHAV